MNLEWLKENTVYVTLHGSNAYGLANEFSDVDVKGICVPPPDVEYNLFHRFEQAENNPQIEEDLNHLKNPKNPIFESTIYSLRKFFLLAAEVNPNIIELLFTADSDHFVKKPLMEKLLANRHLFLSNKARYTFAGYACAQAKKIERHRKWIVLGEVKYPIREEFGLSNEKPKGMDEVMGYMKSQVEKWNLNQFPIDELQRAELKDTIWELLSYVSKRDISVANWPDEYHAGVLAKMKNEFNLKDEVIAYINAERSYAKAKQVYDSWVSWKKERNPARRELEEKCGYDCYSADTEFLTNLGWKSFDSIDSETKLATVNPTTFQVEYYFPLERFDGIFNGNLYHFNGTHTDILVTPNHKMWVRPRERNTKKLHDWQFVDAANLPTGFNILRCVSPITREWKKKFLPLQTYSILKNVKRENILKLIGWYVSEGSIIRDNGKIKGISVSQLKGGRVHNHIAKCTGMDNQLKNVLHEYSHFREQKSRWEMTWNIYGKDIAFWFEQYCGGYSDEKKLPRWIMLLSKREKEMILDSMMNGDGTKRPQNNSEIYYTSSKQLANDVQELAFLCGFETSLWGPYDGMYHIHINRTRSQEKQMTIKKEMKKEYVKQHRILCFMVPNHLLVTRRNGKVGIQGNSKHASHLVRLMRMGYEIITEGKVIVKRPDAEELLAIKSGAWSFDKVMEFKEKMESKLEAEYIRQKKLIAEGQPVPIPRSVNKDELNTLYYELYNEYWK